MRTPALLILALNLVKKSDVLIELDEAQEGDELAHNGLLEIDLDTEVPLNDVSVEDFTLLLGINIVRRHSDREWIFVSIIVKINEPVIKEEPRVALLSVRVIDLLSALDVLQGLDDEATAIISVRPARLPRSLVIKHVSVGYKAIGFHSLNINAKDATSDHHSNLRVLFESELAIFGHLVANRVIVLLNVSDFVRDLVLEGAALEPSPLLLRIEDRKVVESLRQNINVFIERCVLFASFLHHIRRQKRVFW